LVIPFKLKDPDYLIGVEDAPLPDFLGVRRELFNWIMPDNSVSASPAYSGDSDIKNVFEGYTGSVRILF
jgi:hypothetical protein